MEPLANGITWDLSDLYQSPDDEQINRDLHLAKIDAIHFQDTYKPLFEKLLTQQTLPLPLSQLLDSYKTLTTLISKIQVYAYLNFASDSKDSESGSFMQKIDTQLTDIQSYLTFFEVCWNQLMPSTVDRLIRENKCEQDRHFLEKLRLYKPHTLSEAEENIMSTKANTSSKAFIRLFDEINNRIIYPIELKGKQLNKNNSEILSLQHNPNREIRRSSSEALGKGLQEHAHIFTYIFNMILADQRSNHKIRNHQHPMDSMNLANEIELESVLHLINNVKEAYPIASRFYQLKKRLLHLDTLYEYDRYAPINDQEIKIPFDQCKEIVLSGYYDFDENVGKIVEQFFSKRWIDAEIREGKHSGGFCAQTTPDLHPYILVNYTGSMRDVMTVAHELGHGLHQYLAGKKVGILESDAPLTMAETASVFGEMLIFDRIMENEKNSDQRLALLCGKIDDSFATVFRQIAMTDFELQCHLKGLKKGELSENEINAIWIKTNQDFYGDSVELTDNYQHGWKYIPHFIHSPFYCYAYAFAQLFVLSLYQLYKQDKQDFLDKYLEMLSRGGSQTPEFLANIVGLDLKNKNFWQGGLELLDHMVQKAENEAENL